MEYSSESEISLAQGLREPYCIEAEEAVLGGILVDARALDAVAEFLRPEHFYVEAHQTLYSAMLALAAQGRPPVPILLLEHLRTLSKLESIGGSRTLRRLSDVALHAVAIDAHARLLLVAWKRRRVITLFREGYRRAVDPQRDLDELLGETASDLAQISCHGREQEQPLGELMMEYYSHLEQVSQSGEVPAVATGYYDLDRLLGGGLQPATLTYVTAAPAMGKTSWVLNVMMGAARQGVRCLFFSLEMARNSLCQRILGAEAEVDFHRLASARLSPAEWERLGRALARLSELGIDVVLEQGLKASEIATRTKLWMRKHSIDPKRCLVAVDHLTLVRPESGRDETRIAVGRTSGIFRELKNELGIPMLVLSQLNRDVMKRANKRPTLADMQETSRLEQDADIVIGLHREDYYTPDTPEKNIAEVLILKHRNGPPGAIKLLFEDRFTRFLNLAGSSL